MRRFTTLRHMSSQPATGTGTGLVHEAIDFFGWKHFDVFFSYVRFFLFARGAQQSRDIIYTREPGPDTHRASGECSKQDGGMAAWSN